MASCKNQKAGVVALSVTLSRTATPVSSRASYLNALVQLLRWWCLFRRAQVVAQGSHGSNETGRSLNQLRHLGTFAF